MPKKVTTYSDQPGQFLEQLLIVRTSDYIYILLYLQSSPSEGYDTDNYSGVNNENLDQEGY